VLQFIIYGSIVIISNFVIGWNLIEEQILQDIGWEIGTRIMGKGKRKFSYNSGNVLADEDRQIKLLDAAIYGWFGIFYSTCSCSLW
jgi:hypothetical protein